ncbi:MAG: hypothetical protein ACO2PN_19755, partial [Pyrobaculum sp.]
AGVEAGGTAAVKSVEYIQSIIDIETSTIKKMTRQAAAYFTLFIMAVVVVAFAISSAAKELSSAEMGYIPLLSPPPYEEVRAILSMAMSLIAASYITIFMAPEGIHKSALLGGIAGIALQQALLVLL